MHIHFDRLFRSLEKEFRVAGYNISPKVITGIERLSGDLHSPPRLQKDKAYICEYKWLVRHVSDMDTAPLICVLEPDVIADAALFAGRPVIAVLGGSVTGLLLALTNLMYEHGSRSSDITKISRMFLGCASFRELMDKGCELLGDPLVITDPNQRIIAFTEPQAVSNPGYNEILELKYLPTGSPAISGDQSLWDADCIMDSPLKSGRTGGCPAVFCKALVYGGAIRGYLNIFRFHEDFSEWDLACAELLGNFLAIELVREGMDKDPAGRRQSHQQLLADILDNKQWSPQYIEQRQRQAGLKLKKHLYTIVIQLSKPSKKGGDVQRVSMHELAGRAGVLLPDTLGILYKNSVFLLYGADEEVGDFEKVLAPLIPILSKHRLAAGISNRFDSIHKLGKAGLQSLKSLQLGAALSEGKNLYFYWDYAVYYMLELCLKSEDIDMFCTPEFTRLLSLESLEGRNTDYLVETLKVYLKCGLSKSKTAREMNLHLNTIKYRIALLEDILNMELDHDEGSFRLNLSLKVLEYRDTFILP